MRSIISNAIHYPDKEPDPKIPEDAGQTVAYDDSTTMLLMSGGEPEQKPEILIAGCGGTGNAVINRLFHQGFSGPRTLVIDHDKETFRHCHAAVPFFLKPAYFHEEDRGMPEGHPDCVAAAAKNARPDLEKMVGNPDLCIIVAGMSGNAGTASAPEIARIARSRGSRVIALVTLPSRLEKTRSGTAQKGLAELLEVANSVFVLDLNYLLRIMPKDLPFSCCYSTADQVLAGVVRNLYQRVCTPSLINLDYSDLVHILDKGGAGTLLTGETREYNFVEGVCRDALDSRLGNISLSEVTSCIIFIEGHYAGLFYSEQIASCIAHDLDQHADVIWGAQEDQTIPEGEVRVFVLLSTGKKENFCNDRGKKSGFLPGQFSL